MKAYDGRKAAPASYRGRYLDLARGTPIDAWMAAECDYLLAYEVATYNALRPIAYTNWPTLDPLHHPTESTAEEERRWRKEPEAAPGNGREPRGGRGLAGRVARAAHGGEPGGLVRQLPCVSVLPGLHELRSRAI